MTEYSQKQIKKWNKEIDECIKLYKEVKQLAKELNRQLRINEKHIGNPKMSFDNVDHRKLDKIQAKYTSASRKVLSIPKQAWPLTNMSKLQSVIDSTH